MSVSIETRHERARGCGFRKKGGIYLVGGELSEVCPRLPLEMCVCPTCSQGIKPARGWTWINPAPLFPAEEHGSAEHNAACVLGRRTKADEVVHRAGERAGLVWVGGSFYKTADEFMREAARMGVSRRIAQVPRDLVVGETWVFLGHRQAVPGPYVHRETEEVFATLADVMAAPGVSSDEIEQRLLPGVFTVFRPTALEYVVKGDETDDELGALAKRGLTLVNVIEVHDEQEAMEA